MSEYSFFEENSLKDLYQEIQEVYLQYNHPWVIGYSGGKDSTTALQSVWYAIEQLPVEQRSNPVHVISTDTLVETPVIIDYIDNTLHRIEQAAKERHMPFTTHKLRPQLEDTFWVNLVGRGYPAPTSIFRWCTDRLKIQPSNRFILEKVADHGEVVLVLGIRRGESSTRDQVISMHQIQGQKLSRHGQLPRAWVYMPIEFFSVDDVWTYLLQVDSPWGTDNLQLANLYRSAQAGECPLVIDKTTPSCGNSRFGCWTCTVVSKDRSMEAMIDAGDEWMIPLLDFRDWLASTQDPAVKPGQREYKSRNGRIKITGDGQLRYRTYTLEFSREMLRRLLQTELEVQKYEPQFSLISVDELKEIRRLWVTERRDWDDSVPSIYAEAVGKDVRWEDYDDLNRPGRLEADLLRKAAEKENLPLELLQKLLDAEWQHYGMRRRAKIHTTIASIFNEDWRTLEEVEEEMERRQLKSAGA